MAPRRRAERRTTSEGSEMTRPGRQRAHNTLSNLCCHIGQINKRILMEGHARGFRESRPAERLKVASVSRRQRFTRRLPQATEPTSGLKSELPG